MVSMVVFFNTPNEFSMGVIKTSPQAIFHREIILEYFSKDTSGNFLSLSLGTVWGHILRGILRPHRISDPVQFLSQQRGFFIMFPEEKKTSLNID